MNVRTDIPALQLNPDAINVCEAFIGLEPERRDGIAAAALDVMQREDEWLHGIINDLANGSIRIEEAQDGNISRQFFLAATGLTYLAVRKSHSINEMPILEKGVVKSVVRRSEHVPHSLALASILAVNQPFVAMLGRVLPEQRDDPRCLQGVLWGSGIVLDALNYQKLLDHAKDN